MTSEKKKHNKRIRNTQYIIYLTEAERNQAHAIAASQQKTLADLIRNSIFTATDEGGAK